MHESFSIIIVPPPPPPGHSPIFMKASLVDSAKVTVVPLSIINCFLCFIRY